VGGMTFLAASSTLKWVGGISGSGTCLIVTTMSIERTLANSLVGLGFARGERLRHDLGDVLDREAFFDVQGSYAIFEHRHTERTGHRHSAGIGVDRFAQAVMADAGTALFFHERARTAGAAAKAPIPPARQLY